MEKKKAKLTFCGKRQYTQYKIYIIVYFLMLKRYVHIRDTFNLFYLLYFSYLFFTSFSICSYFLYIVYPKHTIYNSTLTRNILNKENCLNLFYFNLFILCKVLFLGNFWITLVWEMYIAWLLFFHSLIFFFDFFLFSSRWCWWYCCFCCLFILVESWRLGYFYWLYPEDLVFNLCNVGSMLY